MKPVEELQRQVVELRQQLEIEAALERVRARTMTMRQSEELRDVIGLIFSQLEALGIPLDLCLINIFRDDTKDFHLWTAASTQVHVKEVRVPYIDHPLFENLQEARKTGHTFLTDTFDKEQTRQWYDYLLNHTEYGRLIPAERQTDLKNKKGMLRAAAMTPHAALFVITYTGRIYTDREIEIIQRFAQVFEQTYTRFLDLKKAEAQAREAQIEAALEKVRARSMAMRHSEEIGEVASLLFQQFRNLDLPHLRRCQIGIYNQANNQWQAWFTSGKGENLGVYCLPADGHPVVKKLVQSINSTGYVMMELEGEELKNWIQYLVEHGWVHPEGESIPQRRLGHTFPFSYGVLQATTFDVLDESSIEIGKRFASVFDQTYTRFLDLQKAEQQAREAQIEAALERVRARAMAMHSSAELSEASTILFEQLQLLGIPSRRCGFAIMDEANEEITIYSTARNASGEGQLFSGLLYFDQHPIYHKFIKGWKQRALVIKEELHGDDLKAYYKALSTTIDIPQEVYTTLSESSSEYYNMYFFEEGLVYTFTAQPLDAAADRILSRFAQVFDLTYRRFLDLQQAEERAREAKVEAALERVRAKAMAMHNSRDLNATISLLVNELKGLNIHPIRCGFGKVTKDTRTVELYITSVSAEEHKMELIGTIRMEGHPVLEKIHQAWLEQVEYLPVLQGELIKSYYEATKPYLNLPPPPEDAVQYGFFTWHEQVGLYAWSEKPYTEDALNVYRKFLSVMGLTFKRYEELKNAEIRARKAKREAALDRVRAGIASMRTAEDLQKITPLIWEELITLEVPFFRCGLLIVDEATEKVQLFLTTPTGDSLAALSLPFDQTELVAEAIRHWRRRQVFRQHWDQHQFMEWTQSMVDQGYLNNPRSYQGAAQPPEKLALHFVPFTQGMLYIGSEGALTDEQLELAGALANAFSVAYSRYEDFKKLEAANAELTKTLADLKATQAQLIQSEKMASLGELTAGIAHEIQNPLNFVNNFSEVSGELLEELREALEKGDGGEARENLTDLLEIQQKIRHHGQRASAIVKGMLDHSRSGGGEKLPTNINQLADEYLRLAYHGIRAKDRSFQATYHTVLAENLPQLNVVPQDIGRVLLNLIHNAFYAANEKKQQISNSSFIPRVELRTFQSNGCVVISVSDNGNGIPAAIVDKIFQPFFTTKPSGKGTGLGLSLSYDIVKAYGGVLQVETEEGKGTTFKVELPV